MSIDPTNEAVENAHYACKASLIGAARRFELTKSGLSWRFGGRSAVWPYASISRIRLSYRPVSMQSRRFRAEIDNSDGGRLVLISTSWQSAALMKPQNREYSAFVTQLHAQLAKTGSKALLRGGLGPKTYAAAVALLTFVVLAMIGLLGRAVATGEFAGAFFLLGFAALFGWQIGGFVRRNRPLTYSFDRIPAVLLP
jgi:hypothetical protein